MIKLDWLAQTGAQTGGSPITSYHLEMNDGTGWIDLRGQDGSLDTTLTHQ